MKISRINLAIIVSSLVLIITLLALFCSCTQQNNEATNANTIVKIGALNGPTSVGLKEMPQEGYDISKQNQPDALVSDIAAENIDIALVPANIAATIYNKTNGSIKVIDINTLNVLKLLSQKQNIDSIKGKTIYSAGKGTVVQANIEIYLKAKGLSTSDVNIQYKSDANEVVASLLNDANAVGIVNEPVASAALQKNPSLHKIDAFEKDIENSFGDKATPITGVTIARTKFLDNNKLAVSKFLKDHKSSIEKSIENSQEAKNCNISFIAGDEMKSKLSSFIKYIYELNPNLVGNKVPDDDFFYINE